MRGLTRGIGKFAALNIVLISLFVVAGGHVMPLWQPLEFLMVAGSVLVMISFSPNRFSTPKNSHQTEVKRKAILGGCIIGGTCTFLLGFIHTMDYLNSGTETVGLLMASNLVGIYYAVLFYFSFRPEYITHSAEEDLSTNLAA